MSRAGTRSVRTVVVGIAAGALALTACSPGSKGSEEAFGDTEAKAKHTSYSFGDETDSQGPATGVKGARKGGALKVLQRDSYAHLDPAQIYVADEGSVSTLYARRLTDYKKDANGNYTVVGDLATDSGKKSDGGRTWTYKLKDGVKWEDGSPITSTDVRHTVERTFAPFITEGPVFIQQWLSGESGTGYRKLLPDGPYKGKHLPKSMLDTPDSKTITFHFKQPVADLPYALAMAGYGIVPKKRDTKQKYDNNPVASGPYKIASFKPGRGMRMVRNPHWDPKTDASRHQYPDEFNIQFGVSYEDSTKRMISDSGENKKAVSFNNEVDASSIQAVASDENARKRALAGYQSFVGVMSLNMDRLKDKRVRQAIAYALPAQSLIASFGGDGGGELAGNYIHPTLKGHRQTDPFEKISKPQGDIPKAKKLLKQAGQTGRKLTYAYENSPEWQKFSVAAEQNLEEAGFDVQRKDIISDTYLDQIGKVDNNYDMYNANWGADWPSGSTVIPPTLDGRQVQDGANNYTHYRSAETNKEIDRISKIANPDKAAKEWAELADRILKKDVPQVPLMYYKHVQLYGSKVGGVYDDQILHAIQPTSLYVKK